MFGFQHLEAWKESIEFADMVSDATTSCPGDERFGLTSQVRRSAVSVSASVAEGSGQGSRDFAGFIGIANGSLMGKIPHPVIAHRREFINETTDQQLSDSPDEIARILSELKRSLDRSE